MIEGVALLVIVLVLIDFIILVLIVTFIILVFDLTTILMAFEILLRHVVLLVELQFLRRYLFGNELFHFEEVFLNPVAVILCLTSLYLSF